MHKSMLCLCAASLLGCAGTPLRATPAEDTASLEESTPQTQRPWTVGVDLGTTGAGAFGSWRFSDHVGLRVGADYLEYSVGNTMIKSVAYDLKARLLSESLILDVHPWKKSSFYVGVGVMFNQNELSGEATTAGNLVVFPTAGGGDLSITINQQPVNPYLSIGGNLLYFDRAHRWALAGELGVAYTGEPRVSSSWTGLSGALLETAVKNNEEALKDWADKFKFYPVVKLSVTYSF